MFKWLLPLLAILAVVALEWPRQEYVTRAQTLPPGAIRSPNGGKAVAFKGQNVELVDIAGGGRRTVFTAGAGRSLRHLSWSPDGRCFTFESYDKNGQSPLTTTHVHVYQADGSGQEEIHLPQPYRHLSTRFDRWEEPSELVVRATRLDRPEDITASFSCRNWTLAGREP